MPYDPARLWVPARLPELYDCCLHQQAISHRFRSFRGLFPRDHRLASFSAAFAVVAENRQNSLSGLVGDAKCHDGAKAAKRRSGLAYGIQHGASPTSVLRQSAQSWASGMTSAPFSKGVGFNDNQVCAGVWLAGDWKIPPSIFLRAHWAPSEHRATVSAWWSLAAARRLPFRHQRFSAVTASTLSVCGYRRGRQRNDHCWQKNGFNRFHQKSCISRREIPHA